MSRRYSATTTSSARGKTWIDNLSLVDVGVTAEDSSLIASAGFKPDAYKAYAEFDICHSLPEVAGPVQSMNYLGYTPDTLAMSHGSLLHQQFNIRHLLKAYSGANEEKQIPKDRIIGCVVATSYPKKPMGGWVPGQAYPIRAVATIFKLADGVPKLLGDHLTSRTKQSVSIETITPFGNIGIHQPSTGETWPILGELPDRVLKGIKELKGTNMPHIGTVNGVAGGEQMVVIYGIGEPINLRGVGMTANPAEQAARIVGVAAERRERDADTLCLVSAEQQDQEMLGTTVSFKSKRTGVVVSVTSEGLAALPGTSLKIKATPEDPVLLIRLPDKRHVLHRCSEVA